MNILPHKLNLVYNDAHNGILVIEKILCLLFVALIAQLELSIFLDLQFQGIPTVF
jgi:hypothetical protein